MGVLKVEGVRVDRPSAVIVDACFKALATEDPHNLEPVQYLGHERHSGDAGVFGS